jgi:hypothetical protein
MPDDPVVEELHQIREKLLLEHGGLEGYVAHLREVQTQMKNPIVARQPRTPAVSKPRTS